METTLKLAPASSAKLSRRQLAGLALLLSGLPGLSRASDGGVRSKTVRVEAIGAGGKRMTADLPFDPQRVAVIDFAVLDALQAWGLESRIVAGVDAAQLPYLKPAAEDYPKIGSLKSIDEKALAAAAPELIFISARLARKAEALGRIAPVLLTAPDFEGGAFASFRTNLTALGRIFGKEDEAAAACAQAEKRAAAVRKKAQGKRAAVVMLVGGRIGLLPPKGRCAMLTNELGFENVVPARPALGRKPKAGGPTPTPEEVRANNRAMFEKLQSTNPDVVFVLNKDLAVGRAEPVLLEDVADSVWQSVPAVKAGCVVTLTAAAWYLGEGGPVSMDQMLADAERAAAFF